MRSRTALSATATLLLAVLSANQSRAESAIVKDAGTIRLADTTFRLDGIDAPAVDQICIDEHADPWACGVEARDYLAKTIGSRPISCQDLGLDPVFRKRHLGICTAQGETASVNQLLVRQGLAINTGHFAQDGADAKDKHQGLWKGCFVAPQEFRRGRKDGALLGGSCRADKDQEIRAALFPEDPAMPPGCSIKGKFAIRARVTGNVGIYHLQGCRSYPALTNPDRWFCSEEDAQAAGFRRAYNCQPGARRAM